MLNPLTDKYAEQEFIKFFNRDYRYNYWRELWIVLATIQKSIGIPISQEEIDDLIEHKEPIDFERVAEIEKETNHDVVAHLKAFSEQCLIGGRILHLGATSSYITDNTDLLILKDAKLYICEQLKNVIKKFYEFTLNNEDIMMVGYTHFQKAQPTTLHKRILLWVADLYEDYLDLKSYNIPLRGIKSATGNGTSFYKFMSYKQYLDMNVLFACHYNSELLQYTNQTYPRKIDSKLVHILSRISESASKFAYDIRLLSHTKELIENKTKSQVGSSAMPFKTNPILSERICSLSRYLISLSTNTSFTAASQWLERSLDDSANRRIVLPNAFMVCNAILVLISKIINRLQVNRYVINKILSESRKELTMEDEMMHKVINKNLDRQKVHEELRKKSGLGKDLDLHSGFATDDVERFWNNIVLD